MCVYIYIYIYIYIGRMQTSGQPCSAPVWSAAAAASLARFAVRERERER